MAAHDPAWPDKIMAAAMLVALGGILAMVFVALRTMGATIDASNAPLLEEWPSAIMLVAGLVALVVGVFAYIHQAWLLVVIGILANFASLGFLGLSTVIGIVALWPLIRSFFEGEETRLDHRRMHAHQWPDKAIMASTLLSVGGAACLVNGLLLLAGRVEMEAIPPAAWGSVLVAVALLCFVSARQVFHLRRVWLAWLTVVALLVSAAFYVVGPAMAVAAAAYLGLAEREREFVDEPVGSAA